MSTEISKAQDVVSAGVISRPKSTESVGAGGVYTVVCHDAQGNEKWSDSFHNLVVNQGLQDMNSKYFKGSGYTAAWYLGLVDGPGSGTSYAAADTLASHSGWTENTAYTTGGGAGVRSAVTFGTATTAYPVRQQKTPHHYSMCQYQCTGQRFVQPFRHLHQQSKRTLS